MLMIIKNYFLLNEKKYLYLKFPIFIKWNTNIPFSWYGNAIINKNYILNFPIFFKYKYRCLPIILF